MSFRKHRLDTPSNVSTVKKISKKLTSLPKKNLFSRAILGVLAVAFFFFVSISVLAHLPSLDWSFDLLRSVGSLSLGKGDGYVPEKPIVNILLTGKGGGDHDAPDLTDTIMLASFNFDKKTLSFLSIPRDLYVTYPTGGNGKINETFMRAARKYDTGAEGMKALKTMVEKITGQTVDYYVGVDFMGFIKAVDILGGVTVNVPEKFVDEQYPDGNWGYTTFALEAGTQTLDGATALKYARSRHSTSDFDRALRQQELLRAIKEQAFQVQNIINPAKIRSLYMALSEHITTDLAIENILYLANFVRGLESNHMISFNLSDSCFQGWAYCQRGGLLYTPQRALFNNMSVLLPDGASPANIAEYAQIQTFSELASAYPNMFLDARPIYLVNTTRGGGVAAEFATMLKKYGFTVPATDGLLSNKNREKKTEILYKLPAGTGATATATGEVSADDSIRDIAIAGSGATASGSLAAPDDQTLQALSLFFFVPIRGVTELPDVENAPAGAIEILIGEDYELFLK